MNYQIGLLKVPVSDVAVSAAFYVDVLGFTKLFVAEEYGWAQLQSGDVSLALYEVGKGGGNRTIGGSTDFHLVLDADPFEALAKTLLEGGYLSENRIHSGNDGSRFVDVLDPDQNLIKIMKRRA